MAAAGAAGRYGRVLRIRPSGVSGICLETPGDDQSDCFIGAGYDLDFCPAGDTVGSAAESFHRLSDPFPELYRQFSSELFRITSADLFLFPEIRAFSGYGQQRGMEKHCPSHFDSGHCHGVKVYETSPGGSPGRIEKRLRDRGKSERRQGKKDPFWKRFEDIHADDYHAAGAFCRIPSGRDCHRRIHLHVGRRGQDGSGRHCHAGLSGDSGLRDLDGSDLCGH